MLCRKPIHARYFTANVALWFRVIPPTVTRTGANSEEETSGIRVFTCATPTHPGAEPACITSAGAPPTLTITGSTRFGGGSGAGSPSGTGGPVRPAPVGNRGTTDPTPSG